jgi:ornithine carbamoyltransferase
VHLLYLGEGNNTAAALALAAAQTPGMMVTFITPPGYGLDEPILEQAYRVARRNGGLIKHHHDLEKLPRNVDVVYTTRWETMGEPHTDLHWRETFAPYSVTPTVMAQVSRPLGTILLHDLPAVRGQDISDEVLNGPQSLAWRQAHYKMYSAMATLEWCFKRCS